MHGSKYWHIGGGDLFYSWVHKHVIRKIWRCFVCQTLFIEVSFLPCNTFFKSKGWTLDFFESRVQNAASATGVSECGRGKRKMSFGPKTRDPLVNHYTVEITNLSPNFSSIWCKYSPSPSLEPMHRPGILSTWSPPLSLGGTCQANEYRFHII